MVLRNDTVRTVATVAALLAVSLILSWVESLIPLPFGLRLGLSNFAVVLVLYRNGFPAALGFGVLKCLLSLLFLGRLSALLYSLCGIVLAVCAMAAVRKTPCFSLLGVNAAGAVLHGVGQLAAASLLLNTFSVWFLLPLLTVGGIISSSLTWFPLKTVLKHLQNARKNE